MRVPYLLALACAITSAPYAAADELRGGLKVSGEIGVVSDYRWRGYGPGAVFSLGAESERC